MNKILLTTLALVITFTASVAADTGSMAKEDAGAMAPKSSDNMMSGDAKMSGTKMSGDKMHSGTDGANMMADDKMHSDTKKK